MRAQRRYEQYLGGKYIRHICRTGSITYVIYVVCTCNKKHEAKAPEHRATEIRTTRSFLGDFLRRLGAHEPRASRFPRSYLLYMTYMTHMTHMTYMKYRWASTTPGPLASHAFTCLTHTLSECMREREKKTSTEVSPKNKSL